MSIERDAIDYFKANWTGSERIIESDRPEKGYSGKILEKDPVLEVGVFELERKTIGMNRPTALIQIRYRLQIQVLMRKALGMDAGWGIKTALDALFQNKILTLGTTRVQFEEVLPAVPLETESPSAWILPWGCNFTLIQ